MPDRLQRSHDGPPFPIPGKPDTAQLKTDTPFQFDSPHTLIIKPIQNWHFLGSFVIMLMTYLKTAWSNICRTISILACTVFNCLGLQAQTLDTLIDVGSYKLHFNIIKGKGIPILFEAGGGEDATTWKKILQPIADRTGTTLITYDRAGFGKSTFDTARHGILNGVIGLETGLKKLGFDGHFVLVAHSQGGLYAQLYACRHPEKVSAAVLIDVTTTCFYDKERLARTQQQINLRNTDKVKASAPASYYQGADFSANIEWMRKFPFPNTFVVTDLVSDHPPFQDSTDIKDWKICHRQFATAFPNRTGILASGCGHFIFNDDPPLVINAIVRAYTIALGSLSRTSSSN